MEMTLGLVIISVLTLVGLISMGYAMCNREDDYMGSGVILLVIALISCGVRYIAISDEKNDVIQQQKYELCVKEGKEVTEVLGTKVCKL